MWSKSIRLRIKYKSGINEGIEEIEERETHRQISPIFLTSWINAWHCFNGFLDKTMNISDIQTQILIM